MNKVINKAAVLGAGVMGSGIAALLAGVGIQVTLLDVVPKELTEADKAKGMTEQDPAFRNRFAQNGLDRIKNPESGMLFEKSQLANIRIGNMTDDLDLLGECDWIIEVVLERLDVKRSVMQQIAAHRKPGSIVSTNTSGVSITEIAEGLPEEFVHHFLGTHFFNPPRFMRLFEMIPTAHTLPEVMEFMGDFAEHQLGKSVVYAKDTPNFIGNRVGVYAAIRCMQLMEKYGYNIPTVDSLSGVVLGRAKTASFKTADLVGLDILCNVANNVLNNVKDPAEQEFYALPQFVKDLTVAGALGDKVKHGFYQKTVVDGKKVTLAYDLESKTYQPLQAKEFPSIKEVLKSDKKYVAIAYGDGEENRFAWDALKGALLYAARLIPEIADDYCMVDRALVAGFNWEIGPFKIWDMLGVERTANRMKAEGEIVPAWVEERLKSGKVNFYDEACGQTPYITLSSPKYAVVEKNECATLRDLGDDVLCLEFRTKGNSISEDSMDMIFRAAEELTTERWRGLVLGNEGKNFSGGADLGVIGTLAQKGDWKQLEALISKLQSATMALKYADRPVVAAPFGTTLGGGAEVAMHAACATPHAETYMGLVEAGVGLIPAGGGCTELLVRAVDRCFDTANASLLPAVKRIWKLIATGAVTSSAHDAVAKGFLSKGTHVIFNKNELLDAAKKSVLEMADLGYHPPTAPSVTVLGDYGRAAILYDLELMEKGGFISAHDALIARKVANVLTGGNLPSGVAVSEQQILDLEREAFLSLCGEEKTQQRIAHMLTTGKPLRN